MTFATSRVIPESLEIGGYEVPAGVCITRARTHARVVFGVWCVCACVRACVCV